MENLKFTAGNIAKLENEAKDAFNIVFTQLSLRNLALFVKVGLFLNDSQEAFDKIDEFFRDGKDIEDLYLKIAEKLKESGFLSKALDLQTLLDKKAQTPGQNLAHSGEEMNQLQSELV